MKNENEILSTPKASKFTLHRESYKDHTFGAGISEAIAHFLGTPAFIFWLTVFCIVWIAWNTIAPEGWRFDSAENGFTALTLMLSLQASYAAPLILFAQNKQAERDKVSIEQDRQDALRNLNDTEFLMREIADIRAFMQELSTQDFVKNELRDIVQELQDIQAGEAKLMKSQGKKLQVKKNAAKSKK